MIKSKFVAIRVLRAFRTASELVEGVFPMLLGLPDSEKQEAAKPVGELLGAIVCDVYYPIITIHPELRPVELLGKAKNVARYRIFFQPDGCSEIHLIKDDILPDDAYSALNDLESEARPGLCWLELKTISEEVAG